MHDEKTRAKEADEAFRQIHNEAIKETFIELEDASGSQSDEGEKTRLALWWHNTAARFNGWRIDFQDKAEEWRIRFQHQAQRIQSVIGWHQPPGEESDGSAHHISHDAQQTQPKGQEPER